MVLVLSVPGLMVTARTCEALSGAAADWEAWVGLLRASASMYTGVSLVQNLPFLYCFQFQKEPSFLFPLGPYRYSYICLEYTCYHPPTHSPHLVNSWASTSKVTHSNMSSLTPKSEVACISLCSSGTFSSCLSHPFPPCFVVGNVRSHLLVCFPTSLYSSVGQKLCLLPTRPSPEGIWI